MISVEIFPIYLVEIIPLYLVEIFPINLVKIFPNYLADIFFQTISSRSFRNISSRCFHSTYPAHTCMYTTRRSDSPRFRDNQATKIRRRVGVNTVYVRTRNFRSNVMDKQECSHLGRDNIFPLHDLDFFKADLLYFSRRSLA